MKKSLLKRKNFDIECRRLYRCLLCRSHRIMRSVSTEEVRQYLELDVINGLFVVGRSIGMIGHIIDEKRNKQGLYRTPFDDIAYRHQNRRT